ncbi:MAG: uracil-DNA glycosylase, partial [Bacteroidales bacterium]|nr:uracil-DNA glycosylase [Bacteroidales bacterium]
MNRINPLIESGWNEKLMNEFRSDYFFSLKTFLKDEKRKHVIYPPGNKIFEAFNLAPFNEVKVVILGQDPYHGKGQAHGLCFSVLPEVPVPPSLGNIYKEINNDMNL